MMSAPREEVDSLSEVEQLGEMSSEVDEMSLVQGSAMLEVCDVNYGADQPTVMQPVLGTIYQDQSGFSNGGNGDLHSQEGQEEVGWEGAWQAEQVEGDWQGQEGGSTSIQGMYEDEDTTTDSYGNGEAAEIGRAEGFEQLGLVISGVTGQAAWTNTDNAEPTVSPPWGRGRGRGRFLGKGQMMGVARGVSRGSRGIRGSRFGGRGVSRSKRGNWGKGRGQREATSPGGTGSNNKGNQTYQSFLTDYPLLRMVKKAPTASDCYSLNADFAMIDPSSMDQCQTITITRFGIQIRRAEPGSSASRFTCELCQTAMDEVQDLRLHLDKREHTQYKHKAITEGIPIYNRQKIAITHRRKHGISTPGIKGRGRGKFKTELEADDEADGTIHSPGKSLRHPSGFKPPIKQFNVRLQDCAVHLEEVTTQEVVVKKESPVTGSRPTDHWSGLPPVNQHDSTKLQPMRRGRGRPPGPKRHPGPKRQLVPRTVPEDSSEITSTATGQQSCLPPVDPRGLDPTEVKPGRGGRGRQQGMTRTDYPQQDTPVNSEQARPGRNQPQSLPTPIRPPKGQSQFKSATVSCSKPFSSGLDACSDDTLWAELLKRRVLYQCSCGFNFDSSARYFLHRASHSTDNERCCSICGAEFSNWIRFHAHFFQHDC